MTIMLAVNGQNIWTPEEGRETSADVVYGVLIDNEVEPDVAYRAIGAALVNGNADIETSECVMTLSIV